MHSFNRNIGCNNNANLRRKPTRRKLNLEQEVDDTHTVIFDSPSEAPSSSSSKKPFLKEESVSATGSTERVPTPQPPRVSLQTTKRHREAETVSFVYVLRLKHAEHFYIGQTSSPTERHAKHAIVDLSNAFIKACGGAAAVLHFTEMRHPYHEMVLTLSYMERFGIENVRGWIWNTQYLSIETQRVVQTHINHGKYLCNVCGEKGHFEKQCKARAVATTFDKYCERCHRHTHTVINCFATTTLRGNLL